ncbi:TerB family tellurite resistance protein [Pedobacter sp.]
MARIRLYVSVLAVLFSCALSIVASAQSAEVQQLMLNVEKLSQLKNILSDMKRGYTILSGGYNTVKNIAQGNFSLHEVFLDGLMVVSPEVRKYHKVAEILRFQVDILSGYKSALKRFSVAEVFSSSDRDYLKRVYGRLNKGSLQNLDRLLMVVTSSKLRMDDSERLSAIDRIHADMSDKLLFLRAFNRDVGLLELQRSKAGAEMRSVREMFREQ